MSGNPGRGRMGSGEGRNRRNRTVLLGAVVLVCLASTTTSAASYAVTDDAYLQDYSSQDGAIPTDNGNLSMSDLGGCGFRWSAQAVIDTDLPNYSQNGFLESVWPTGSDAGSGYLSLQHWVNGPDVDHIVNDQLNWRIPIAVDHGVADAQVTIVFDDPDWTPNPGSLHQYSEWTQQPGYESAFHRFTGVTGYVPHDDSQVGTFVWGSDESGDQTLTFSLGNLKAGTSTVIGLTGTARSEPGVSGVDRIRGGTAYGMKLEVDGVRPLAECYRAEYPGVSVQAGASVEAVPVAVDGTGADAVLPHGTVFALGSRAPAGATIDPGTGAIHWPVPALHPGGETSIPVTIRLPDDGDLVGGSRLSATALIDVVAADLPGTMAPSLSKQEPSEARIAESGDGSTTRVRLGGAERAEPDEELEPLKRGGKETPAVPAAPTRGVPGPHITVEASGSLWSPVLLILGSGLLLAGAGSVFGRKSARETRGPLRGTRTR